MKDNACVKFLQWCLPELGFRWKGFKRVRGQVCKRINKRINELGLSCISSYKIYIKEHPEEWTTFDSMCRVTISRFWRDRNVFNILRSDILPLLASNAQSNKEKEICCLSIGCASGEEPYSLQIIWKSLDSKLPLRVTATDMDMTLLDRARKGVYQHSSLKDMPDELIRDNFSKADDFYTVNDNITGNINFLLQDIRKEMPSDKYHLILCRNLVFTYFNDSLQRDITTKLLEQLLPGGFIIIGIHESLPEGTIGFLPYKKIPCIFQKSGD